MRCCLLLLSFGWWELAAKYLLKARLQDMQQDAECLVPTTKLRVNQFC
jgi:hypothetical protein